MHAESAIPAYAYPALCFFFGLATGATELISHYRDEPIMVLLEAPGILYMLINGLVSLFAFFLLRHYPDAIMPSVSRDSLLAAIAGGFGSMVALRSKLFTYKDESGREFSIGPAIVLEAVLGVLDRMIDRQRAWRRFTLVFKHFGKLTKFTETAQYLGTSLLSFQNVTADETANFRTQVDQMTQDTLLPSNLKIVAIGFVFLTIVGEDNFERIAGELDRVLQAPSPAEPSAAPTKP